MAKLPPCRSCLNQHVKRINFQCEIWRHAHVSNYQLPDLSEQHGQVKKDGILKPLWTDGDIVPQPLECALEQVALESDSESEEEGFEDGQTMDVDMEYSESYDDDD